MRYVLVTAIMLFAYSAFSQIENTKLKFSKVDDNHFLYTTYNRFGDTDFPSNSMYVVTTAGVVLIDTPWDTTQFQPLVDSIFKRHKKEIVLCISTHFHADRTAGLEFLRKKGVKTYTSKLTYDLCRERKEKQAEFYFRKDTTFVVGQEKFEAYYPGEGHSKDNIVIWFEDGKIIYAGCLVKSTENNNLGNIADANLTAWKPTIEKLIKRYPRVKVVVPGHFGWQGDGLQHTIKLLQEDRKKNKR